MDCATDLLGSVGCEPSPARARLRLGAREQRVPRPGLHARRQRPIPRLSGSPPSTSTAFHDESIRALQPARALARRSDRCRARPRSETTRLLVTPPHPAPGKSRPGPKHRRVLAQNRRMRDLGALLERLDGRGLDRGSLHDLGFRPLTAGFQANSRATLVGLPSRQASSVLAASDHANAPGPRLIRAARPRVAPCRSRRSNPPAPG